MVTVRHPKPTEMPSRPAPAYPKTSHHVRLTIVATFCTSVVLQSAITHAQIAMPEKDEWKLHDGTKIQGKAYDFGYELCFIQRRLGKLLMNGQQVDDPRSSDLLRKICEEYQIPLTDPKSLHRILSKQPFAQIVKPYYTIKYHDTNGQDRQVPILLLAAEEKQMLRPIFEVWRAEKQREHEERVRQAQELRNQQMMLAMQAQALQAQQAMAMAAEAEAYASARSASANERSAAANEKQAEELRRIRQGR